MVQDRAIVRMAD